uniref:Deltameth_res domain-containing protein n=1 Tax=Ascaris lumbricoides TaxID=6252 RepID=A0A0M3I854_ASCLU
MRSIAALSRLAYRRSMFVLSRRFAHGHEVMNPGPPVTLDYMPIPYKPYKTVYNELQTKFNKYLAISATLLIVSLTLVRLELKVPLSG